ncbi:hypothetical protein V8F20_003010 [Naviculisporaceae sp. PSN 640]
MAQSTALGQTFQLISGPPLTSNNSVDNTTHVEDDPNAWDRGKWIFVNTPDPNLTQLFCYRTEPSRLPSWFWISLAVIYSVWALLLLANLISNIRSDRARKRREREDRQARGTDGTVLVTCTCGDKHLCFDIAVLESGRAEAGITGPRDNAHAASQEGSEGTLVKK